MSQKHSLLQHVDVVDPVGHEGAGCDEVAPRINRWQAVASRKRNEEIAMADDRGIRYREEAAVGYSRERYDRSLDIGGIIADLTWDEFDCKGRRCCPGKSPEVIVPFEFWIGDECDAGEVRRDILKHLEPLAQNAALVLHHPGEIAPGPGQTRYEA